MTEKVKEMTREIAEKDERLRANEELLNKMHSEKKKADGELERMRVSLKDKDEVVKKLEDDLIQQKSKEKTTSPGKTNDDKNGIIIAQQHLKQKIDSSKPSSRKSPRWKNKRSERKRSETLWKDN